MKLRGVIQKRYKVDTFEELAKNVSETVGQNSTYRCWYHDLILKKKFIPAGNTLLAGTDPIRPNCCILPPVSDDNFRETLDRSAAIWTDRIGIGFDLTPMSDPVKGLQLLSKANMDIDLVHRPIRGNMAVVNINHPRILDFIQAKAEWSNMFNFNISVSLCASDLKDESKRDKMQLLADCAWRTGDPGILFVDRIGKVPNEKGESDQVIVPHLGRSTTMVPCGEQNMFPNEVCTLGSMNLACPDFWKQSGNGKWEFNDEMFEASVVLAVRFLDDVVDLMDLKDPLLKAMSLETRRIGLGVMGWADVLKMLNVPYGSTECMSMLHHIGTLFKRMAHFSSFWLGGERGTCPALKKAGMRRRNLTITCIAPTGGITLLTENKGFGIEPMFEDVHNVSPLDHMNVHEGWQMYVDNSISKTINLRESVTVNDVLDIWHEAGRRNIKSVTVYRDKSKEKQPMVCKSGDC